MRFETAGRDGYARAGKLTLNHGIVETPVFMPVGTNGAIKMCSRECVKDAGAQIVLANAFHLYLKPGLDVLRSFGGIHNFASWDIPILTDSGGFQVFSLSKNMRVDDEGVDFKSPFDGSIHKFTPEKVVEIQEAIGSDIAMVLDECLAPGNDLESTKKSVRRTGQWAERALKSHEKKDQNLFGITQGGFFEDLRKESTLEITSMPFDGFGIGGLSVGEDVDTTIRMLDVVLPLMPQDKPRYLMGVGDPVLMLEAIERGVDMMDCVLPTRMGRHGGILTSSGRINIRASVYEKDPGPLDSECDCKVCKTYSRGYIHHLIKRGESTGMILATYHNIYFLTNLMKQSRNAIIKGEFDEFKKYVIEKINHKKR
ncbi:tRNA guanosine(34) transglycosylase Tgt [Athalassotoga sp.]|uniref:tRNA guanosine(34) transglycosylase Tgt n=1 Tax=Athalassotoga sp. TaxID=2022597 RepID=UPI003CFFA5D8